MQTLKKLLGYPWIHLQSMRGSITQNEDYCSKEATLTKIGLPFIGKGGNRNVQEIYEMTKAGKSDIELAEWDFSVFARTLKAIDRIRLANRPLCLESREIILLFGEPGCGKTKWAYDNSPNLFELPVGKGMWFDGYQNQREVLLDEYEGQFPLDSFLKVVDRWYVRAVPIKGSFVWWNPNKIIMTCNIHPSLWYNSWNGRSVKAVAFRRRLTKVFEFPGNVITEVKDIENWFPDPRKIINQNIDNNYLQ